MSFDQLLAVGLDGTAHYISWGPILISVTNLVVIAFIVLLFVLALVVPFPKSRKRP
jgi:large-conductance mechanosensitive channel